MQKIMFNDRYGLTQAVIEGRKTMTRRIELIGSEQNIIAPGIFEVTSRCIKVRQNGQLIMSVPLRYKVGEVVAVAQSYKNAGLDPTQYIANGDGYQLIGKHRGWRNKMYVKAELMPHRIRITGVRCERLQDISGEDCMKEGVVGGVIGYYVPGIKCKDWSKESHVATEDGMTWKLFPTPREAFALLINKVSGKGTWQKNPWVVVYEFELVK